MKDDLLLRARKNYDDWHMTGGKGRLSITMFWFLWPALLVLACDYFCPSIFFIMILYEYNKAVHRPVVSWSSSRGFFFLRWCKQKHRHFQLQKINQKQIVVHAVGLSWASKYLFQSSLVPWAWAWWRQELEAAQQIGPFAKDHFMQAAARPDSLHHPNFL